MQRRFSTPRAMHTAAKFATLGVGVPECSEGVSGGGGGRYTCIDYKSNWIRLTSIAIKN